MATIYWQKSLCLSLSALIIQSALTAGFPVSAWAKDKKPQTPLDQLPLINGVAVPPSTVDITGTNYVAVGQSNASQFGQLLWEQQDSIQQEVLSGLNSLGPGFSIFTHDIDKGDFQVNAGVDITAKRIIHPVNLGIPENGVVQTDPLYPDEVPRSGWVVVDTLRTGLSAGFGTNSAFQRAFGPSNKNLNVGEAFETGVIIRKVSIINTIEDFTRYNAEDNHVVKTQMDQLNAAQNPAEHGDQNKVLMVYQKARDFVDDALIFVGNGLGLVAGFAAQAFESGPMDDLFNRAFSGPYRLDKELFFTNAAKVLAFTRPGDILSIQHFNTYGPSIGGSVSASEAGSNFKNVYSDGEIRITRLDPTQCELAHDTDPCHKVLVSFIAYEGVGPDTNFEARFKFLHLKPWWAHLIETKFYQAELRFKFDLDNPIAQDVFNKAVNINNFSQVFTERFQVSDAKAAAKNSATTGVRQQFFSVIGNAEDMATDGKIRKRQMTAVNRFSREKFQAILVTDDHQSQTTYYKKCGWDYNDVGEQIGLPQCTFDGLTEKTVVKVNFLNFDKLIPFKFLHPLLDHPLDFRQHSTEEKSFESFTNLNTEVDGTGANLHFRYTVSDKFPLPYNYFNYNLRIVKTMLGLLEPSLADFYNSTGDARALRDKVMKDLSNPARAKHMYEKNQGLNVDIYMSQTYTNDIFKASEDEVKNAIAEIVEGGNATWNQLFTQKDHSIQCPFNWKYDGMVVPSQTGTAVTCFELQQTAKVMWGAFSEIAAANPERRLIKLTDYTALHGNRAFIPLLMLMLGRNHQQHVAAGDLGIQLYYEAEDLLDTNDLAICKMTSDIPNGAMTSPLDLAHHGCRLEGFKPYLGQDTTPPPGTPRIVNLIAVGDKNSLASKDPKVIVNFYSDLEKTPDNNLTGVKSQPFRISGYISKYGNRYHEPLVRFEIPQAIPQKGETNKGHMQYRYTFVLSDLLSSGHLKKGENYVLDFSLSDPAKNTEGENTNYSEYVEVRFSLPKK